MVAVDAVSPFVPLLISVVRMYMFNIKVLPWKRDNRISPLNPFKPACLPSPSCVFFFVCLWSLIRPLLTALTKWPLRRCWWASQGASQVSVSFFTFPPSAFQFTDLPHLVLWKLLIITRNQSHKIWLSSAARGSGGGGQNGLSAELNVQDGVRGVWLTTDCLAVSKSFRQSGSRFYPWTRFLPVSAVYPPEWKRSSLSWRSRFACFQKSRHFWKYGWKTITIVQSHNWFILHSGQDRCQNIFTAVN